MSELDITVIRGDGPNGIDICSPDSTDGENEMLRSTESYCIIKIKDIIIQAGQLLFYAADYKVNVFTLPSRLNTCYFASSSSPGTSSGQASTDYYTVISNDLYGWISNRNKYNNYFEPSGCSVVYDGRQMLVRKYGFNAGSFNAHTAESGAYYYWLVIGA